MIYFLFIDMISLICYIYTSQIALQFREFALPYSIEVLGPSLLPWLNFNPSMDK